MHDESNDFPCNLCDKAFKTKYRLDMHITRTHHLQLLSLNVNTVIKCLFSIMQEEVILTEFILT